MAWSPNIGISGWKKVLNLLRFFDNHHRCLWQMMRATWSAQCMRGRRTAVFGVDVYAISLSKNRFNINFSQPSNLRWLIFFLQLQTHLVFGWPNVSHARRAWLSLKMYPFYWVFQTGCFAPGFTRNDRGTACPCLLPPLAVKSKPPAVRVVVDSFIDRFKIRNRNLNFVI